MEIKIRAVSRILILFLMAFDSHADENKTPPPLGNFALPSSQQPGPLVGFGQNTLDKNKSQFFIFADDYVGVNQHSIDLIPGILYGITDNLSIFLNAPYAASYQSGPNKSTGFEDASAQLEYAFFNHSTTDFVDQATVVAGVTAPTGSIHKNPSTGVGSPSYFLGTTFNRTYQNWFVFASPGATLTTAKNGTKFGNRYLYQFGFGRNIRNTKSWLFAWMAEFDGTYSQKNREQGLIDPDSGGNIVYVTPSLWASTKDFIFQFGVGFPMTQHFYGNQTRQNYLLAANIGWNLY